MSAAPLRLSWAHANDVGGRESNQDALGAARNGALSCFALADGTGGHRGGGVAAQMVVDALLAAFCAAPACDTAALNEYVHAAIARVAQARREDGALADMSSTVAAVVIDAQAMHAVWAHLGDSRVYLLRDGRVHSVTRDHSLARQLIDGGYAALDTLRTHPQRHILLAAIGVENDTPVCTSDGAVALEAGDALLVCSDGLWEWIDDAQMEAALAASARSDDWLGRLCEVAAQAAGVSGRTRDNYSAYAIRVHAAEQTA